MKRTVFPLIFLISMLLLFSLACSLSGTKATEVPQPAQPAGQAQSTQQVQPTEGAQPQGGASAGKSSYKTDFPMPNATIENFTDLGNGSINYQVKMDLKSVIDFYRQAIKSQGMTEREVNFSQTDTTFSMVFDGASNGKQIVIQGVVMGDKVNVNIRYETV